MVMDVRLVVPNTPLFLLFPLHLLCLVLDSILCHAFSCDVQVRGMADLLQQRSQECVLRAASELLAGLDVITVRVDDVPIAGQTSGFCWQLPCWPDRLPS